VIFNADKTMILLAVGTFESSSKRYGAIYALGLGFGTKSKFVFEDLDIGEN
jgi:hypothetical protein